MYSFFDSWVRSLSLLLFLPCLLRKNKKVKEEDEVKKMEEPETNENGKTRHKMKLEKVRNTEESKKRDKQTRKK